MLHSQKQQIAGLFHAALQPHLAGTGIEADIVLERPRDPSHGDVACNVAMQLAKKLKKNPRELAQALVASLLADPARAGLIEAVEIAGPGFINLRLSAAARQAVVTAVLREGAQFGKSDRGAGKKVMVEFVSANPTGPLHVGHGRQGALGDAMSALFQAQGYDVTREYYYNDAGVQIATLALSVQARARGLAPGAPGWPETAYNGDYIGEIAADFVARKTVAAVYEQGADAAANANASADADASHDVETGAGVSTGAATKTGSDIAADAGTGVTASGDIDDLDAIRRFAVAYLRREQDLDLQAFGVRFDNYFLESSLYGDGKVASTVAALIGAGKTYELDGALWLRSTDYGDDKDRVMRKSDGTFTYFVPDVAYHISKWQRGFGKVINVQGSDHHGTIARVRAGLQAVGLGIPTGYPDYVLHKMVTVMKGGEEVKISKRAGSYVTLRDLIEWSSESPIEAAGNGADAGVGTAGDAGSVGDVGKAGNGGAGAVGRDLVRGRDAVRFFLISRKADTEFVFDVDLARAQSDENPVYYVQYAHARICSVMTQWGGDEASLDAVDLAPLVAPREVALLAQLAHYPQALEHALEELGPHQVAFYLRDLAGELHSYYNAERVLVDDVSTKMARLALMHATRQVLRNGLTLLGVSAPSRM